MTGATRSIGAVVIGRNEGARLERCLNSLVGKVRKIVYVDSGSTDNSVELSGRLGAYVLELERSLPFTAARARNAGFEQLLELDPGVELVQFVDGDCELVQGWLEVAERRLLDNGALGVVCGRRRERYPEASVFNRLCDLEWDTPIGEAASCGGDALMRVTAFRSVGGFKDELIAGEEPELCLRLRCKGWRVERLDAEMTLHDAAMQRVGQWFRRALRSGHAFAELAFLHGASPERPGVRQTLSNLVWGAVLPLGAVAASFAWGGAVTLLAFGAYGVLTCRVYRAERRRGRPRETAALFSLFCVAGKIPEALGAIKFWSTRVRGLESTLIEYKSA